MSEQIPDGAEHLAYAREKVNPPAIGLIVVASLGLIGVVLATAGNLWVLLASGGLDLSQEGLGTGSVGLRIAINVLSGIVCGYILYGAVKMRRLQSIDRAKSACIFAMIPCIGPCVILGIPFGIWGFVMLKDPKVRAAFDASVADTFR